jgi:hypothetical protein
MLKAMPGRATSCLRLSCHRRPCLHCHRASFGRQSGVETIFDRSAVIDPVTAVAAPMIPAAPIRTPVSSPPRAAPVHTCDRRTDRSPATTPIAAPPHRRTWRDARPGNDGHRRRCDSGRRRFSFRWRGRDLEVRRMSGHERRRRKRQCGDNREKTLTQDILQWATVFACKSISVVRRFIVGPSRRRVFLILATAPLRRRPCQAETDV